MSEETLNQATSDEAPGWDAISQRLQALYPDQAPRHFGTMISYALGGPDPLDGISAWKVLEPRPHWHFVTYGFSELYAKESDDRDTSGYGFELTFRLACDLQDDEPPMWALNFLQNLARYVFDSGNVFKDGDWMSANGPISEDHPTSICSMAFVTDPQLPGLDTVNGHLRFLQVVGLTADEERAAKQWRTRNLLEVLLAPMPLWVTDLDRGSLLEDAQVREQVAQGSRRDGSSTGFLFTDLLWVEEQARLLRKPLVCLTVSARQVDEWLTLLPLRLPFGKPLLLAGAGWRVRFVAAQHNALELEDNLLTLSLTAETLTALVEAVKPQVGEYSVPAFKDVQWRVQ